MKKQSGGISLKSLVFYVVVVQTLIMGLIKLIFFDHVKISK